MFKTSLSICLLLACVSVSVTATDIKKSTVKVSLIGEAKLKAELAAKNEQSAMAKAEIVALLGTKPVTSNLFGFDSATLDRKGRLSLSEAREQLVNHKGKVVIIGHCDEKGGESYNYKLGLRRADSVKEYLISIGVNAENIETISYGNTKPIINEAGKVNSYRSRRVEVFTKEG